MARMSDDEFIKATLDVADPDVIDALTMRIQRDTRAGISLLAVLDQVRLEAELDPLLVRTGELESGEWRNGR